MLDALIHGYVVTIWRSFKFRMYYINSSDLIKISRLCQFARSGAIHGVYFSIECKGKLIDEFKPHFKPLPKFLEKMEERLDDPDLVYKLIT